MLCSIFSVSILGLNHHIQGKVWIFFHLRNCVGSQNVSDFETFVIWAFHMRDAQPAQTCFLHCGLQDVRDHVVHISWKKSFLGLPRRQ